MSILDVCCLSETKTFEHFSDFLTFTLSSKTSLQLGLNQPTDMFHHSTESWEHGEDDGTWAGALRTLCWPPKQCNILLPNSLATVVYHLMSQVNWWLKLGYVDRWTDWQRQLLSPYRAWKFYRITRIMISKWIMLAIKHSLIDSCRL